MIKIQCEFDLVEYAENARKKILSECGSGNCEISESKFVSSNERMPIYAIPSNYGVNISPQTLTDVEAMQITTPLSFENSRKTLKNRKLKLTYIGFESDAKKAEKILINLRGANITRHVYP